MTSVTRQLRLNKKEKMMKYFRLVKVTAFLLIISFIAVQFSLPESATAANKKYGIVIANQKGSYTFYDMNDSTDGKAAIEITSTGSIMVPLKRLIQLMPGLTYQYNATKKTMTIKNTANGKKIVYTKDSKYLTYYSSSKAKAVSKIMVYKMYLSKNTVMVHMSSLKWVLQSTGGLKYYKSSEMQTVGYDTLTYSGLILYNPYQTVNSIPKATIVTGISSTIKVTIPEGYSVAQTFNLLVKKGVCSSTKDLYSAMENYDFTKYPLVSKIADNENRCFKLEGYLYPDTYEFYRLSKAQDAIGKFLRNTEAKITAEDRKKAESMGYNMDEILTIASMIEKETPNKDDMPIIASIIYNRLGIKMRLRFDSTINYVERYIKPYISGDINRYNSYYNTYKCSALPASPICNPGKAAINAALNPVTTDYLYFYSDLAGEYHFSKEWINSKITPTPVPTNTPENTSTTISTNPTITPIPN